jgi:hypothetical protein
MVIVLDGTCWDPRQAEVVAAVAGEAEALGASVKYRVWSEPSEFAAIPRDMLHEAKGQVGRGRFVTPLMEGGLGEEEGSIVCLVAGRVPDWQDWALVLARSFAPMVGVRLRTAEVDLTDCVMIDAVGCKPASVTQQVLALLLGNRVAGVEITFAGCLPAVIPEGFTVEDAPGGPRITMREERSSLRAPLGVVSSSEECEVDVVVHGTDGSTVRGAWGVRPALVPAMDWRAVGDDDARDFQDAVDACLANSDSRMCAVCGTVHGFSRALICSSGSSGFFDDGRRCVMRGVGPVKKGELIVIHRGVLGLKVATTSDCGVVWAGATIALRAEGGWLCYDDSGSVLPGLPPIGPGLSGSDATGLWIAEV